MVSVRIEGRRGRTAFLTARLDRFRPKRVEQRRTVAAIPNAFQRSHKSNALVRFRQPSFDVDRLALLLEVAASPPLKVVDSFLVEYIDIVSQLRDAAEPHDQAEGERNKQSEHSGDRHLIPNDSLADPVTLKSFNISPKRLQTLAETSNRLGKNAAVLNIRFDRIAA